MAKFIHHRYRKGQVAAPGQFIVSRPSIDLETGAPRIDTYTNKNTSGWDPVDGKPGGFLTEIAGAQPIEVIKVPDNYQGTFDVSYGGTAPFRAWRLDRSRRQNFA